MIKNQGILCKKPKHFSGKKCCLEKVNRVYTIGFNEKYKLEIKGNTVNLEGNNEIGKRVFLECYISENTMILSLWNNLLVDFRRSQEPILYDTTLDLNNQGDRWEGACMNGSPYGYGLMYDYTNHILYRGFMFEGKKVCFGEEYYENSDIVEYGGSFVNGLRHGWGYLYDKKGRVIYEGNWLLGSNDLVLNVGNECISDGFICNDLKELVIGDNCFTDMKILILHDYFDLERLEIGDSSFTNVNVFKVYDCNKLSELIIGENSFSKEKNTRDEGKLVIKDCVLLKIVDIRSRSCQNFSQSLMLKSR